MKVLEESPTCASRKLLLKKLTQISELHETLYKSSPSPKLHFPVTIYLNKFSRNHLIQIQFMHIIKLYTM